MSGSTGFRLGAHWVFSEIFEQHHTERGNYFFSTISLTRSKFVVNHLSRTMCKYDTNEEFETDIHYDITRQLLRVYMIFFYIKYCALHTF